MQFIYTLHAEEKLQRLANIHFGITKEVLEKIVLKPDYPEKTTSTGEVAVLGKIKEGYNVRVVYVKVGEQVRIITFHIARSGRYGSLKDRL